MKRAFFPAWASFVQAAQAKPAASEAETKAIADIEKAGGRVLKIAQNDEHLEVNFKLEGASVTDASLASLRGVTNIVHLNLGKTSVTDAGLAAIKGLTQLTELHLEETKITDKGLASLKDLKSLAYLNLYGTAVTDAGLDSLKGLANLRHLYLWQTKATEAGVKKLKSALPNLEIVAGWEPEPAKK
jgi:Leucine-rich repeat (LRR) protein